MDHPILSLKAEIEDLKATEIVTKKKVLFLEKEEAGSVIYPIVLRFLLRM